MKIKHLKPQPKYKILIHRILDRIKYFFSKKDTIKWKEIHMHLVYNEKTGKMDFEKTGESEYKYFKY